MAVRDLVSKGLVREHGRKTSRGFGYHTPTCRQMGSFMGNPQLDGCLMAL